MDRAHGLTIPRTLQEARDAEALALIVYDMQAGIVSQLPDGPRIAARVGEVLDVARRAGVRIFFTRHLSLPTEVAGVGALRAAMAWQHRDSAGQVVAPFPRDSPQFQIVSELTPRPSEVICDKITMSAFTGTFLDIALRDCGIRTFLIAGFAVEVGIEPTVRHATDLGYVPIIVTDACGHGNAAAAQRALESLAFAGGSIQTDIAAMRAALEPTTPALEPDILPWNPTARNREDHAAGGCGDTVRAEPSAGRGDRLIATALRRDRQGDYGPGDHGFVA